MVETPTTLKSALQKNFNYSRFWSKCVSDPGNNKIVRFNPNVTQINYLPETPVKESLVINDDSEGDEEEEDEELAIAVQYIKMLAIDKLSNAIQTLYLLPGFIFILSCQWVSQFYQKKKIWSQKSRPIPSPIFHFFFFYQRWINLTFHPKM